MRCANPRRGADAADREYPLDVIVFVATGFRQVGLEAGRRSGESPGYWERRRPRYLFTGLMQCAVRGGGIVHFNKVYVGRANARNKGTCDNKATIYQ